MGNKVSNDRMENKKRNLKITIPDCNDIGYKEIEYDDNIDLRINNNISALWLICDKNNELKLLNGYNNLPLINNRWTPLRLKLSKNHENVSMPWSYYRDITFSMIQNETICRKPKLNYFILAQIYKNNKNDKFIPFSLQQSLIKNVNKLSMDITIKYDLFDITKQKYLYPLTNRFGIDNDYDFYDNNFGSITPPIYYTKHLLFENDDNSYYSSDSDLLITPKILPSLTNYSNSSLSTYFKYENEVSPMAIPSPMNRNKIITPKTIKNINININININTSNNHNNNHNNSYYIKLKYNKNINCMTYSIDTDHNDHDIDINEINTSFVHCLIDPNKYLNDHHLWIPSVFDCRSSSNKSNKSDSIIIKSPICGLDYVKYKLLYQDISKLFKRMQPMFENVLNRKLGSNEKVIVKINKYILQKNGDFYDEILHKKGMGENIECIGLYFIESNIINHNGLKLSLIKNKIYFNQISYKINIGEGGDCLVFRNEAYHKFMRFHHNDNNNNNNNDDTVKYQTVLMFYVLNNDENIMTSNCERLKVNLIFYWKYIINYWLRYNSMINLNEYSFKWMNDLIYIYLFGQNYDEYIYHRRQKILNEKQKVMLSPNDIKLKFEKKHFTKIMPIYHHHDDYDDDDDLFEPPVNEMLFDDHINYDINHSMFQMSQ